MSILFSEGILFHQMLSWPDRGDRAVGIEYVSDTVGRKGGVITPNVARASQLVVLSAGAFGSPAILERSGIGAKSVLEKNGIKQRVELPGVGELHGYVVLHKPTPHSSSFLMQITMACSFRSSRRRMRTPWIGYSEAPRRK